VRKEIVKIFIVIILILSAAFLINEAVQALARDSSPSKDGLCSAPDGTGCYILGDRGQTTGDSGQGTGDRETGPSTSLRAISSAKAERDWLDDLIEKIWFVESSGKVECEDGNSTSLITGDNGKAGGPLQIHPCVVEDVNFYRNKKFTLEDRYDLEKAKQIARLYIEIWMEVNREEIAARIYNGGPRGFEKNSTKEYFSRVQGIADRGQE
jgi:hypothetical protein